MTSRHARHRPADRLVAAVDVVAGRPVRSWSAGVAADLPGVVFVPGLGAPGYLLPWAGAVSAWTRASVVDLPGWRWGRARSSPPTLDGVAAAVIAWIGTRQPGPVVLVGHSTGAQAVIRAALRAPQDITGVVLVGPTFDPRVRHWWRLLGATIATVAHEDPAELPKVLPAYLHSGGGPLLRFLRDALPDEPERAVRRLVPPVVTMTGRHDAFAPPGWSRRLAEAAGAPHVVFPGSHNFCFPHWAIADVALHDVVRGWARPSPPRAV